MKKVLLTLVFALMASGVYAHSIDGLYDNYQAVYVPSTKTWSTGAMADGRIVLTKKTSPGSGSYSEYYYSNGKKAAALKSNFEFIKQGRLILVDNADLKYSELIYSGGKFVEKPLVAADMEKLLPGVEVVRISQFDTEGKITIKKGWFDKKTILLLNDTKKDFYKYDYKPKNVNETDIKGLITLKRMGRVTFSHYNDDEGKLSIYVRN